MTGPVGTAGAFFGAALVRFAAGFGGAGLTAFAGAGGAVAGLAAFAGALGGAAGFAAFAGARRADFAADFFFAGAEDFAGARVLALRFVAAFFATFLAAAFFATFLATFLAAAFFATFFAAVLRRAAGRLAFAALRAVFRLRVVGIIVSGSSARLRVGPISNKARLYASQPLRS